MGFSHDGSVSFSKDQICAASSLQVARNAENQIQIILNNLKMLWKDLKLEEEHNNNAHKNTVFRLYVNRLYDVGLQSKMEVLCYFSKSLKLFSEKDIFLKKNHKVIIQAHIDVINLCFADKITSLESFDAKNLQIMLNKAIEDNT